MLPAFLSHNKRVNYKSIVWQLATVNMPEMPPPKGNEWETDSEQNLKKLWSDREVITPELKDIAYTSSADFSDEEMGDDIFIDAVFHDNF